MSKHFFSLIHGGKISLAPGQKIVPQKEVETLLSAEEVLNKVKQDAEQYKIEVASECEKLKARAKEEGFEEGFKEWAKRVAKLEAEIETTHKNLEKLVIPVALKAAKKIIGRELELSENVIVDIVANNLKAVAQHKKIVIYVNKKDFPVVESERDRLKSLFENLEVFSVRERSDVSPGGCVIETEGGIINAKLENQWQILEQAFEQLMKGKIK